MVASTFDYSSNEGICPSFHGYTQFDESYETKYCDRNVSKLKLPNLERFIPSDRTLKKIAIVATFACMCASAALTGLSLSLAVASAVMGNAPGAVVMAVVTVGYAGVTALFFMRLSQLLKQKTL